ncbi:hypothetical protein ACFYM0_02500 [Streptomyces sp. NPDC006487]|uniref:hypothetical protein n=1 Tax=Streptomyces sp. NPDC006487 TaxID=3364748 RepID=UPI0036AD0556
MDFADNLPDMDEEQDLLTGADVIRDMRGQQLDVLIGEDPAAQPPEDPSPA